MLYIYIYIRIQLPSIRIHKMKREAVCVTTSKPITACLLQNS
jgi:hypothetical protein